VVVVGTTVVAGGAAVAGTTVVVGTTVVAGGAAVAGTTVVAGGAAVVAGAVTDGRVVPEGTIVADEVGWTLLDGDGVPDKDGRVVGGAPGTDVAPHATASSRAPDQSTDRAVDPISDQLSERVVSHAPPTRTAAPDT
jgi:hypothetical protein